MATTDHDLVLVRRLKASPANVYRCWTEPELLKQWFAPRPVETIRAEIDARPGGRFNTTMRIPDHGEMTGTGCFLVTEPGHRLVWTSALSEDFRPTAPDFGPVDFTFTCELTFTPIPEGCEYRVVLRHASAADAKKHADMGFEGGWGTAAAQLEEIAATLG